MFLSAEEPITVEVKRRSPTSATPGATSDELSGSSPKRMLPVVVGKALTVTNTASIGVQTEDPEVAPSLITMDDDDPVFYESPVSDQIVNIFDECLVPDVDFEVSTEANAYCDLWLYSAGLVS